MKKSILSTVLLCAAFIGFTSMTYLGGPLASIAGKSKGLITQEEIITNPKVEACGREVLSFEMTLIASPNSVIQKTTTGARLSSEMIDLIKNAQAGQKIYFEDIMVKDPKRGKVQVPNMVFTLK